MSRNYSRREFGLGIVALGALAACGQRVETPPEKRPEQPKPERQPSPGVPFKTNAQIERRAEVKSTDKELLKGASLVEIKQGPVEVSLNKETGKNTVFFNNGAIVNFSEIPISVFPEILDTLSTSPFTGLKSTTSVQGIVFIVDDYFEDYRKSIEMQRKIEPDAVNVALQLAKLYPHPGGKIPHTTISLSYLVQTHFKEIDPTQIRRLLGINLLYEWARFRLREVNGGTQFTPEQRANILNTGAIQVPQIMSTQVEKLRVRKN
jgi:hypothetical protein